MAAQGIAFQLLAGTSGRQNEPMGHLYRRLVRSGENLIVFFDVFGMPAGCAAVALRDRGITGALEDGRDLREFDSWPAGQAAWISEFVAKPDCLQLILREMARRRGLLEEVAFIRVRDGAIQVKSWSSRQFQRLAPSDSSHLHDEFTEPETTSELLPGANLLPLAISSAAVAVYRQALVLGRMLRICAACPRLAALPAQEFLGLVYPAIVLNQFHISEDALLLWANLSDMALDEDAQSGSPRTLHPSLWNEGRHSTLMLVCAVDGKMRGILTAWLAETTPAGAGVVLRDSLAPGLTHRCRRLSHLIDAAELMNILAEQGVEDALI